MTLSVSVVIPIFNEEPNLRELDAEIRGVLEGLDCPSEILYVDDASTDDSAKTLNDLLSAVDAEGPRTRLIRLRRNFGQTSALAAGFAAAGGDVIIGMDGDRQNNPADIPRLLERLDEGYDVVSGWRRARKDALQRRLPSRIANWLIARATGLALHDYGCTLKAYRADLLKQLHLYGEMHRFIPVFLYRIGARVTEEVVDHRPRGAGTSKYGSRRIFKVFLDLFLLIFMSRYYTRPMHFFGIAALFFLAMSVITSAIMVVFKFGWLRLVGVDYQASFIETPLPALVGTFFLGAVALLAFGVLGELLTRVRHEIRDIKPYLVMETRDSAAPPTEEG